MTGDAWFLQVIWYWPDTLHRWYMKPFCVSACLDGMRKDATHPHIEVNTHAMLYTFISLSSFFLIMIQTQFDYFFFVFSFFFIYHQISSSFQSHYFHLARCINLPVPLSLSLLLFLLSPAMHLFGLNWQLQESESYGAFENGVGGRDTTPNTFMVSTDNGGFPRKHTMKVSLLRQS